MKKALALFLSVILACTICPAYADLTFNVEDLGTAWGDSYLPVQWLSSNMYFTHINGVEYFFHTGGTHSPTKYNQREFDFFVKENNLQHYIWTGEYYMARYSRMDYAPRNLWLDSPNVKSPSVKFYDKDFNLVKEKSFGRYVLDIGYYKGVYYCFLPTAFDRGGNSLPDTYMASIDMENWVEVAGPIPRQLDNGTAFVCEQVYSSRAYATYLEPINQVSINDGAFYEVHYENPEELNFTMQVGDWIIKYDDNGNCYFSTDNVYFTKVAIPQDLKEPGIYAYLSLVRIYETDDDLVLYLRRNESKAFRLTVPKQALYDELEGIKDPVYVRLNGALLGFETVPAMEADRTLVPMRFLFEQLGAEVEWDEKTETATVQTENDNRVAFSIDNQTANVNGALKTMDVPARLINDKTMVPLRFLSEELGYTVEWDAASNTAIITTE